MMQGNEIRVLSGEDIRRALPMVDAIEAMKEAFKELSAGRVTMPARAHIDIPACAGTALFMPSYAEHFGKICVIFGEENIAKINIIWLLLQPSPISCAISFGES